MNPIATINGVKVYSTKQMSQINNSKVVFTDGSWCDVATGDIVNNGPGAISIGAPLPAAVADMGKKKVGPEAFVGDAVDISGVEADVEITVGDQLSITIEGPEAEVDAVRFAMRGTRLVVLGESSGKRRGINISTGGGSIHIGGNVINSRIGSIHAGCISTIMTGRSGVNVSMSSGGSGSSSTKVTITVPRGAEVSAQGVNGDIVIGDTEGRVQVSAQGNCDMTMGRIGSAMLNLTGGGDVTIDNINGDLIINRQGSGDVKIKDGTIGCITITLQGSGDVDFGGRAENAAVSITGSGDINIKHVTNRPSIAVRGSGDVNIGNW